MAVARATSFRTTNSMTRRSITAIGMCSAVVALTSSSSGTCGRQRVRAVSRPTSTACLRCRVILPISSGRATAGDYSPNRSAPTSASVTFHYRRDTWLAVNSIRRCTRCVWSIYYFQYYYYYYYSIYFYSKIYIYFLLFYFPFYSESRADCAVDQGAYDASGNNADNVSAAERYAEFLQTSIAEFGIDRGWHEVLRRRDRKTRCRSLI